MEFRIKEGDRVVVKIGCKHTKKSHMGYNNEMKPIENTMQIVRSIDGIRVKLIDQQWTWHKDDLLSADLNSEDLMCHDKSTYKFNPGELSCK